MTAVLATTQGGFSAAEVGGIIAAMVTALLGGGLLGKKVGERASVTIDAQPLRIAFEKDFLMKQDFINFKGEVRSDLARVEANIEKMIDRVDLKHLQLLQTIERAAKTGVDGRVALWNDLKKQGQDIAKIEERTDIGKEIARQLERFAREPKS